MTISKTISITKIHLGLWKVSHKTKKKKKKSLYDWDTNYQDEMTVSIYHGDLFFL